MSAGRYPALMKGNETVASGAWLKTRWDRSFARAEQWYAQHAGQVPNQRASDTEESAVAIFVMNQRSRWSSLPAEKKERLAKATWWKVQVYNKIVVKTRKRWCSGVLKDDLLSSQAAPGTDAARIEEGSETSMA